MRYESTFWAPDDAARIIVSGVAQQCPYPGGNCPPPPPPAVCSITATEQYAYNDVANAIDATFVFTGSAGCGGQIGSIRVTSGGVELVRQDGASTISLGISLPCSPDEREYTAFSLTSSDDVVASQMFNLGPPSGTCPMQPLPDPVATIEITSITPNCSAMPPTYTVAVSGTANIPAVLVEAFAGVEAGRATLPVVNGSYSGTITVPADPDNDSPTMSPIPHVPTPFAAIGAGADADFKPCAPPPCTFRVTTEQLQATKDANGPGSHEVELEVRVHLAGCPQDRLTSSTTNEVFGETSIIVDSVVFSCGDTSTEKTYTVKAFNNGPQVGEGTLVVDGNDHCPFP